MFSLYFDFKTNNPFITFYYKDTDGFYMFMSNKREIYPISSKWNEEIDV